MFNPFHDHHNFISYRTGLVHINRGEPTAELSKDLRMLDKQFAVVELAEGDSDVHGVVLLALTST